MKIWCSYGSEHSMNLVMIGSFKQVADAEDAKLLIEELAEQVRKEPMRSYDDDPNESRFSKEMLDFFTNTKVHSIGAAELEQFHYDVHVEQKENNVILHRRKRSFCILEITDRKRSKSRSVLSA